MHINEYRERRKTGLPIVGWRELIHALQELQNKLVPERTPMWFALNRWMREADKQAAADEKSSI